MTPCDEFIEKIERTLPEFSLTRDLVKLGLYSSVQCAYYARKTQNAPAYFEVGKKIFYPKTAIIQWLKESKRNEKNFENSQRS